MGGVINEGDGDANTGMWGSVYLRPGLQEVATIRSCGDTESEWTIKDDTWYTAPSAPLPDCGDDGLCGGGNATTPLSKHLAHALASWPTFATLEQVASADEAREA